MSWRGRIVCWCVAALALLPASAARASLHGCQVSATSVNFGTYNVFSVSNLVTTGTVTISSCYGAGAATVTIDKGQHSASFSTRDMIKSGGSDLLNYNLYLDAAMTQIWGDGTGGTSVWSASGNSQHTIYGNVPAGQTGVSVGTYSDVVTITVNF